MSDNPNQDLDPAASAEELPQKSDKASPQSGQSSKKKKMLLVRYGKMGQIGFFNNPLRDFPSETTHVIVNTERGLELGEILLGQTLHKEGHCHLRNDQVDQFCANSDSNYPLHRNGKVIRIASESDKNEQRHLDLNVKHIIDQCDEFIKQDKLKMKLVDAEHLFGGDRIIFYFMAEGRVDFRHLVKQLAQHFQTRIEMRQIGARDEARLVGDFETCGRECCCKNFLKVLKPVNMRMAKLQKATLDPSKISGRCGRLKCCLRYEDEVYNDLHKNLPRKGSCVRIEDGYGEVIDTQIITQLVRIRLADKKIIAVHVDDILERNYKPTEEDIKRMEAGPVRGGNQGRRRDRHDRKQKPSSSSSSETQSKDGDFDVEGLVNGTEETAANAHSDKDKDKGDSSGRNRNRRRRRRKPSDSSGPKENTSGSPEKPAPAKRRRRSRGRRRGKGPNSKDDNSSPNSPSGPSPDKN